MGDDEGNTPVHSQLLLVTRLYGTRLREALDDLHRPVELRVYGLLIHHGYSSRLSPRDR